MLTVATTQFACSWDLKQNLDRAEQLAISDSFRGAEGAARFEALLDRLIAAVKRRATQAGGREGARWAELWVRLSELPERAAGLNMDKSDVLAGALADIARTKASA